jgi:hypothetical protein
MAPLLAVDDPSIERLTAASPQLAETILCAARGFSGSSDVPPEGAMDWCLGVDYRAAGEKIVLGRAAGASAAAGRPAGLLYVRLPKHVRTSPQAWRLFRAERR